MVGVLFAPLQWHGGCRAAVLGGNVENVSLLMCPFYVPINVSLLMCPYYVPMNVSL